MMTLFTISSHGETQYGQCNTVVVQYELSTWRGRGPRLVDDCHCTRNHWSGIWYHSHHHHHWCCVPPILRARCIHGSHIGKIPESILLLNYITCLLKEYCIDIFTQTMYWKLWYTSDLYVINFSLQVKWQSTVCLMTIYL